MQHEGVGGLAPGDRQGARDPGHELGVGEGVEVVAVVVGTSRFVGPGGARRLHGEDRYDLKLT